PNEVLFAHVLCPQEAYLYSARMILQRLGSEPAKADIPSLTLQAPTSFADVRRMGFNVAQRNEEQMR
ncbi:MAG: hypothetical protein ACREKE_06305, partial [bacterium]